MSSIKCKHVPRTIDEVSAAFISAKSFRASAYDMARTKQTARKSIGGKSCCGRRALPCYERHASLSGTQRPTGVYSLRSRGARKATTLSATSQPAFPFFSKLPQELRTRIWEMATEARRIVAVFSSRLGGLRSSVPPILHVCAASRAIGLRVYSLSFAGQKGGRFDFDPSPARVYFNFERDILFFRRGWNAGAEGPWSCINYFEDLINIEDLQRINAIGFDLKVNICSEKGDQNHMPQFHDWTSLKTLYLGLEGPERSLDCQIELQDLQPEDYSAYIEEYCKSSCWYQALTRPEGAAGIEWIKTSTMKNYRDHDYQTGGFDETLIPVRIIEL